MDKPADFLATSPALDVRIFVMTYIPELAGHFHRVCTLLLSTVMMIEMYIDRAPETPALNKGPRGSPSSVAHATTLRPMGHSSRYPGVFRDAKCRARMRHSVCADERRESPNDLTRSRDSQLEKGLSIYLAVVVVVVVVVIIMSWSLGCKFNQDRTDHRPASAMLVSYI
jgi:hypothetical protein